VYNDDCFNIINILDDECLDLVIVDPPYGDGVGYGRSGKEILNNEDELWAYCEELKMSKKDYEPAAPMTDEQRAELMEEIKKAFLQ
jgi:DNA modification methylase